MGNRESIGKAGKPLFWSRSPRNFGRRPIAASRCDGFTSRRPLEEEAAGIPTVKDRVVQAAVLLILEPIFEADLRSVRMGSVRATARMTRWGRSGARVAGWPLHDLRRELGRLLDSTAGEAYGLSADAVVDGSVLRLIKQWLQAPVVGDRRGRQEEVKRNEKARRKAVSFRRC